MFALLKLTLDIIIIVLVIVDNFLSGVEKEFKLIVDMALSVVVVQRHFVVKHVFQYHKDALQVKVRLDRQLESKVVHRT